MLSYLTLKPKAHTRARALMQTPSMPKTRQNKLINSHTNLEILNKRNKNLLIELKVMRCTSYLISSNKNFTDVKTKKIKSNNSKLNWVHLISQLAFLHENFLPTKNLASIFSHGFKKL